MVWADGGRVVRGMGCWAARPWRWGCREAPHLCFSPVPLGSRWRGGHREVGDQVRKGQIGQEDVGGVR